MTYSNLRVGVGYTHSYSIDRAWCYDASKIEAVRKALTGWDAQGTPPDGWHRDLQTGMRRTDGDPNQEYYNP